jgi:hypothetical protein
VVTAGGVPTITGQFGVVGSASDSVIWLTVVAALILLKQEVKEPARATLPAASTTSVAGRRMIASLVGCRTEGRL